jgi:small redox-active disulfide protein 2
MKIEVFGPGCAKCEKTYKAIDEIMKENKLKANLEKITDITQLMERGVVSTPAVFIDGEQKIVGKVPDKKTILSWFQSK